MRILIATESFLPRSNGVTNSVLKVGTNLKNLGHEVQILAPGKGPFEIQGLNVDRVPSIAVDSLAQVDFPTIRVKEIASRINRFKPDVLHLASPFLLGDQARRVAKQYQIPSVAIFQTDVAGFVNHYGLSRISTLVERRIKKIHSTVDLNLAPSTHSKSYLENLGIENIKIWGRGVDTGQFNISYRNEALRQSWGANENTIVVGFAGRLAPEKCVENLRVLHNLESKTGKKVQLVIIGDGPSRERLATHLPYARFTGHLSGEQLGQAMASLDVLVSTGEKETFCQVIQEAMACQVPVVAPATGGPLDLVEPGHNGYLYQPGSLDDLRSAVQTLIDNPQQILEFGQNGESMVRNRTWLSLTQSILGHYETAIASSHANSSITVAA
ncbi:MAG: glycosyltransferase family 1 protein [Candidatus Nanopelagicales bacterium]|nr:glycosyltransferase family 1 protein [Candidatus Nanopelagicales bacterium]